MNSTNIKVMSEEIQHLKNEVHNLDVEIPAHPSTDAGKYLGVAADGSLAWSKVPDELPPTTGATAGQILALDNDKEPEWANNYNLNYSETEINTGKKWVDGKDIYCKTITGDIPVLTESYNGNIEAISIDNLINSYGYLKKSGSGIYNINCYRSSYIYSTIRYSSGNIVLSCGTAFSEFSFYAVIYYTKPTPSALTSSDPTREAEPEIIEEPETETKSTRTKKSTK